MNHESSTNGNLYSQVLKVGGVTGLLSVMLACFLMWVVYQGQQKTIELQEKQIPILEDIRRGIATLTDLTRRRDSQAFHWEP